MNEINERIIKIFEKLDIKQVEFADRIGVSQAYISLLFKKESDKIPSDRLIRIISSEFNINEDWLRTGDGDMENSPDTFSLDEYAKQKGLSDLEFEIIKGYMELDKDLRKGLMAHLKSIFNKPTAETEKKYDDEEDLPPPRVAEEVKEYSSKKLSAEEREEEYIKNVLKSAPKQVVSASSGTEDINKVV